MSVVTSETGKNGTFSSPNYPSSYPAKTRCRYDFIGRSRERVQIVFTDFNLYHPDGPTVLSYGERSGGQGKSQIMGPQTLSQREKEKEEEKRKEREKE
jgi:hypothetical protein